MSVPAALWLRGGTDAGLFTMLDSVATTLRSSLTEQEERRPAIRDLPETSRESTSPNATAGNYLSGAMRQRISAIDHTAGDHDVCGRPPANSRREINAQPIYKWVDEDGQTHIADQRPQGRVASVVDLGMTKQDFTYEIIPDGVALPLDFQGQLAAGSKRMYDTWNFFLGEEQLRQSRIQLLLIGDPERFDAYYANGSPGKKQVSGFYSMSKNQAVVKFDPAKPAQTSSSCSVWLSAGKNALPISVARVP